jgi:hypothetical protein
MVTATARVLYGPGIKSQWKQNFLHPFRPAWGPTQLPVQRAPGLVSGSKATGAWIWTTTLSSAAINKRVRAIQWTLELRPDWHTNNFLGYDKQNSFDLRPKSWVTTRMPVKATWVTTRMAFVSFSLSPDTRVCRRNSGQYIALYN